jgi:tetratricopeptide (TPR) repeat protein
MDEPERAIVLFNEVIARLPENALGYELRGRAFLHKGDLDRALEDFDQSLRLQPDEAHALAARALTLLKKHDQTTALADVDRGVAQEPSVEGYSVRAEIYEARGENDRAIADLRKATEVRPKSILISSPRSMPRSTWTTSPNAFPAAHPVGAASATAASETQARSSNFSRRHLRTRAKRDGGYRHGDRQHKSGGRNQLDEQTRATFITAAIHEYVRRGPAHLQLRESKG